MRTLLLLLAACRPAPEPGFHYQDDATTLPARCEAPAALLPDPLTLTGEVRYPPEGTDFFLEAMDIALRDDLAYVVGAGGLTVVDLADPAAPTRLAGPWDPRGGRQNRVALMRPGYLATSHRERGVTIWDVLDPYHPLAVADITGSGLEGIVFADNRLYVGVHHEGLRIYDASRPDSPRLIYEAFGLKSPWSLALSGDGWLYAADNLLGVVPVDLRDPTRATVGEPVPTGAATLHVSYAEDRLYVSLGADGVAIYDVTDRARPERLTTLSTGGSAVMSDVKDDLLWVADHSGLSVFDLTTWPPVPFQQERAAQFALAVKATETGAVLGDWNAVEVWALDRSVAAPALKLPSTALRLQDGVARATVVNRGAGPLTLTGLTVSPAPADASVSATGLEAGEAMTLRFEGAAGESEVCLASDDPDEPVLALSLRASAPPPAGVRAPDFTLQGLDGRLYRLSDQLGAPVLLAYFATW